MSLSRWRRTARASISYGMAALCLCLLPQAARAGAPPTGLSISGLSSVVPQNGVWTAGALCWDCPTPLEESHLAVVDSTDNVISGSWLINSNASGSSYITFIPEQPFALDETYTVRVDDALERIQGWIDPTFTISAAVDFDPVTVTPTTTLRGGYEFDGETVCCEPIYYDAGRSSTGCSIVPDSARAEVSVSLRWDDPLEDAQGQYQFRTDLVSGSDTRTTPWSSATSASYPDLPYDVDASEAEVCVTVHAKHIKTGEQYLAHEGCTALGDVRFNLTPEEAILRQLEVGLGKCIDPGEFEADWCETFEPALGANDCSGFYAPACEAALERCGDGNPNAGSAGAGSTSDSTDSESSGNSGSGESTSGTSSSGSSTAGGATSEEKSIGEEGPNTKGNQPGCQCQMSPQGGSSPGVVLAVGMGVFWIWTRRRPKNRTSASRSS